MPGPCSRTRASCTACAARKGHSHQGGSSGTICTHARAYYVDHNTHEHHLDLPTPQSVGASPATPPPPAPPRRSYLRTQPTQTAPTTMCTCPSGGGGAARPTGVRISSNFTLARQRWNDPRRTTASASAATSTALANRAAPGPLPSGWEMHMTSTRRIYIVDHNTHDYVGRPAVALDS